MENKTVYRSQNREERFLGIKIDREIIGLRSKKEILISILIGFAVAVAFIYVMVNGSPVYADEEQYIPEGVSRADVLAMSVEDDSHRGFHVISIQDPVGNYPYDPDLGIIYDNIPLSEELQRYTYDLCRESDVRYEMILALMYRESRFQQNATNLNDDGTYDHGLCQINDVTLGFMAERGLTNPYDPYENIKMGVTLLQYHLDNNGGNEQDALMAYQYGATGADLKASQGIFTSDAVELLYQYEEDIVAGRQL